MARVAGIQAAKRTSDMIRWPPTAGRVGVGRLQSATIVAVQPEVDTVDRTGVEMEALLACHRLADRLRQCKSANRGMVIGESSPCVGRTETRDLPAVTRHGTGTCAVRETPL